MTIKLTKGYLFQTLAVSLLMSFSGYAIAQEAEEELPKGPAAVILETEALQDLENYTGELLKGLRQEEAQYIYEIRMNFGVIRSIREAQNTVRNAVKSCGEENPDLKGSIDSRFETWESTIDQSEAAADKSLKDAISRQAFRPVSRVNKLLGKVEKAFEERDSQINRIPITTEEACVKLLASMDETQENITTILGETTATLDKLSVLPLSEETEENVEETQPET